MNYPQMSNDFLRYKLFFALIRWCGEDFGSIAWVPFPCHSSAVITGFNHSISFFYCRRQLTFCPALLKLWRVLFFSHLCVFDRSLLFLRWTYEATGWQWILGLNCHETFPQQLYSSPPAVSKGRKSANKTTTFSSFTSFFYFLKIALIWLKLLPPSW